MNKIVWLLLLSLLFGSGAGLADDVGEYEIQAWGLKSAYWPAVARSRIPLYGLLKKEGKAYRFVRFSTVANTSESWVHLPSRKPTWFTGKTYCRYRLFTVRSCPRYEASQFMERDVGYIGATFGGLISLGILPLVDGVHATFQFDRKGFKRALDKAYKDAGIDADALAMLEASWQTLAERKKEGDALVEKARYDVKVGGTGNGALKGVSAKWLVGPTLSYPWLPDNGLTENDFSEFSQRINGLSKQYATVPLKEVASLSRACPHARASEWVKQADCGGVQMAWDSKGISLTGSMTVAQWRLALPRQVEFNDEQIHVRYDNGALIVGNKVRKPLILQRLQLVAFGEEASSNLASRTIRQGESANFFGFVGNGMVRQMESAAPLLRPEDLSKTYEVRVHATYNLKLFQIENFYGRQEFEVAKMIRSELEAVQAGRINQSIDEREFIARSRY